MTVELLRALQNERAFDPTVRFEELGALHMPFDEMHQTQDVEDRVRDAIRRAERVALIGTTGSGKSSTAAYVADPLDTAIVAFRIGVTVEDTALLAHPGKFAQYVVRRIAREATEIPEPQRAQLELEVADTRELRVGRSRRTSGRINAAVFELAVELGSVSASIDQQLTAHELIEGLDHALDLLRSTGAVPVLIIDDSDTWLEVEEHRLEETQRAFFGPIMRMLAERNCGLVVAVDERYLDLPEYRPARDGFLPTEISVPRLRDSVALSMLVKNRIDGFDNANVVEAFAEPVLEEMFAAHVRHSLSLRALMRCANSALYHTCAAGSSRIGVEAFSASLREYAADVPHL